MLIVGELINTSRKAIKPLVEERDAAAIQDIAQKQVEAGAHYIDVNCGTMVFNEPETMAWLVETIQEKVSALVPGQSQSPNSGSGFIPGENGQPMIVPLPLKRKIAAILPLVTKYKAKIIALCMDDAGMPETAEERLAIAKRLVEDLTAAGVAEDDIYLIPWSNPSVPVIGPVWKS